MKVLLLNPPAENTVVENPGEEGEEYLYAGDFGSFPPLGMLYVLSYLEKYGSNHQIFFKDCVAEKISHADLDDVIRTINPDVVGITSFTIQLVDVCMAAQKIRKIVPNVHICLGGHHPIAFPMEAADLPEFDSIIVGEGEIAFTKLVEALALGENFTDIVGVYTKQSITPFSENPIEDSRFLAHVMVPPAYIEDIDSLPPPNRNYIKHINYQSILGVSNRLATLITTRGCPYWCTFCDVPFKKYRQRNIGQVLDEVEACLEMGYDEFHFYDDLFNISARKVIAFCDEIASRKLKFEWDFRGRVNTVTHESLVRLKEAGCRQISFGVETGNDAGLKSLKKRTNVKQIRQVFAWCHELKIQTVADYMIGLPFEKSADDVRKNVAFLLEVEPDYVQFSVLTLYPNTELYNDAVSRGLVDPQRWQTFSRNPTPGFFVDHWEEFLTVKEMVQLQEESYRRFYLRFSYVWKRLKEIKSPYEFFAKVRGAIKLAF